MGIALRPPLAARIALWVTVALFAGYALHAQFTIGGHGLDSLFQKWINDAVVRARHALVLGDAPADRLERRPVRIE
jgi:fatty acid desaturase